MNATLPPEGLLAGVKVLDLSGVGPGARCARILADLGADVVRVVPPARPGSHRLEAPFHAYGGGRGWRRLVLDLKQPEGRALYLQLVQQVEVVVEGFRPGVAARLGVGFDAVAQANPKAVYCAISGYGQDGPAAQWVGHDLNYDALAGLLATTDRRADGAPAIPGLTVADTAGGGMHAVISILAALLHARAGGRGCRLDVSMTDGVLYLMSMHVDEHLAGGPEPVPGNALLTGGFACYDLYRTADGRWLALGAIESGFFANVCRVLGCEQCIPHQMDPARQDEIRAALRAAFATRSRADWLAAFAGVDCCITPVNRIAEVAEEAQFAARGCFVTARHPEHGEFRQVGALLAGSKRLDEVVPLPATGATHSAEVLAGIGVQAGRFEQLKAAGVVG